MYDTKKAFDTYVTYLALKRHFTSDYDYFKYGGKVRANKDSFERRRDKYFFYKLSKRKEAPDIILANMIVDPSIWVGKLLDEKSIKIYQERERRLQSLSYTFRSELSELDENLKSNFEVNDGQLPRLLSLYNMKRVGLETVIILTDITNCISYWDENISDTIVYPDINRIVEKTRPFLQYDRKVMKKIILDTYENIR